MLTWPVCVDRLLSEEDVAVIMNTTLTDLLINITNDDMNPMMKRIPDNVFLLPEGEYKNTRT